MLVSLPHQQMTIDPKLITWIESTLDRICAEKGYGHIHVIWHVKDGKVDGTEKRFIQTDKEQGLQDLK
jgi:hypothetical protein